jgi:hypothetical protein
MGQQMLTFRRFWCVLPASKNDVLAQSKGSRIHGTRGFGRLGIGVDADPAEIVTETWFKEGAGGFGQGPAAALQRLYAGCQTWSHGWGLAGGRFGLKRLLFLLFWLDLLLHQRRDLPGQRFGLQGFFFIPTRGISGKGSGRFQLNGRLRHAHHHIRHSVSFLLVAIVRLVDR